MKDVFEKERIVYLTNTGCEKMVELQPYIDCIMAGESSDYVGGGNERHRLEPYFYETGAPRQANLHYHHEMTYISKSIKRIAFAMTDVLNDGLRGATYLSDAYGMTNELMKTELGHRLKDKGLCYWRNLTDAEGTYNETQKRQVWNHWQQSFGTDCPEEA